MLGFGKKKKKETPSEWRPPVWIWGRDYLLPGDCTVLGVNAQLAAGIAPGNRKTVASKTDGNEDAMGYIELEEGHCLLLADSHFGKLAAEVALERFADMFANTAGSMQKRLFYTVLDLDEAIREAKKQATEEIRPGCATTFMVAWIKGDQLVWASLGDSFLWHLRDGEAHLENERTPNFLGERQPLLATFEEALAGQGLIEPSESGQEHEFWWRMSQLNRSVRGLTTNFDSQNAILETFPTYAGRPELWEAICQPWSPFQIAARTALPEWGMRRLQPGDRLLLASDGVEEPASLVSIENMLRLAGDKASVPSQAVDRILAACQGRRGGGDNLMCWVLDIA